MIVYLIFIDAVTTGDRNLYNFSMYPTLNFLGFKNKLLRKLIYIYIYFVRMNLKIPLYPISIF